MKSLTNDLELPLNRAPEAAVLKASKLFGDVIAQMTIDDAKAILDEPKNSATKYFHSKILGPLLSTMKRIANNQLSQVVDLFTVSTVWIRSQSFRSA